MSAFIWKKKKTLKINNNQFGKSQIQAIKKKNNNKKTNKQEIKKNTKWREMIRSSYENSCHSQFPSDYTLHSAPLTN